MTDDAWSADETLCVHPPKPDMGGFKSLSPPLYRGSTIAFESGEAYARRNDKGPDAYSYGLHGTPTVRMLEAQIAVLEGGVRAVVTPSGLSALVLVMQTVLNAGDEVLIPDTIYPPVREFADFHLARMGIAVTYYPPCVGSKITEWLSPITRLVLVESPGSTTMEMQDIPAIVASVHQQGALVCCDNTWASPLYLKPLALGADFSVEALTKYAGGHSDLLMGSVAVRDYALFEQLKRTFKLFGLGVSPDDALLVLRGIKTMAVRLAHSSAVALRIATKLRERPEIEAILHPALPEFNGHDLWQRDYNGAGSVFTVVVRREFRASLAQALDAVRIFSIGASWGGVHSILAPMSLAGLRTVQTDTSEGPYLRVSIGLEREDDLMADLIKLLEQLRPEVAGVREEVVSQTGDVKC
ncbi:cystathionine beta-lyase [Devosia sp. 2618]|uniref:cystathionine beta-lyase n=1 Tax=Devosia sp. 2618 TaxID=3156454 RepID=UPI0033910D5B